jgi:hypothetical protein
MWHKFASVRNLELGESGDVSLTAQCKNSAGRWVAAPRPQKATRWKARVYVRGHDGIRQEIVRFGRTRHEAEAALCQECDEICRRSTLASCARIQPWGDKRDLARVL